MAAPDIAPQDTSTPEPPIERPRTVGDCRNGPRPCPWVSCRFNLLLDIDKHGTLYLNVAKAADERQPCTVKERDSDEHFEAETDAAIEQWFNADPPPASCLIDVADDERTLEEIGGVLNLTRQRVRQLEQVARAKLDKGLAALVTTANGDE